MRVWVDLDNTPHALFFRPVVGSLRVLGHDVLVTARADGRNVELARRFGMEPVVVGGARPRRALLKAGQLVGRAASLARAGRGFRPDVAVGHGSRPLALAAAALRAPLVTLYDYEGVSTALFDRLSARVLVPSAMRADHLGVAPEKLVRYPGTKEEVYLTDFEPDPDFRERLGVAEDDVLVVLRPESETAHYRPADPQPLLEAVVARLAGAPRVRVALLARDAAQELRVRRLLSESGVRHFVPGVVDGRQLVWAADVVLGGGGTMTREAAALGVPAWSFFQGRPGAVDGMLAASGRLGVIESPGDAARIRLERRPPCTPAETRRGEAALRCILDTVLAVAAGR